MMRISRPIDDYALASFVAGKLPGTMRELICASLTDDDARRLLDMVLEALGSSRHPDDAMRFVAEHWTPVAKA